MLIFQLFDSNTISAISQGSTVIRDHQQLKAVLFVHFSSLLGLRNHQSLAFDLSGRVGSRIESTLSCLDNDITDEEIKETVFHLPKGKASGPDGLPIEFYQVLWDIVGTDLIDFV